MPNPLFVRINLELCWFEIHEMCKHHPSPKVWHLAKQIEIYRMVYNTALTFLQVQRYEAASTIYGPHTLSAYIQLFRVLAKAIATVINS